MTKQAGAGKFWTQVRSLQEFRMDYIDKIMTNINQAVQIHEENLTNPDAHMNQKLSAANFFTQEYKSLEKEFRKAKPKDFHSGKIRIRKNKKEPGLISLTYEEDTGTDG